MKKFLALLFIFISLVFSNQAFSNDDLIQSLKEGGKIIFIRHAYAPGGGDEHKGFESDPNHQHDFVINTKV